MESLSVVAYRQPIIRAEIEAIRGVHCGEILRQLMERDLVRIVGKSNDLGRPFLYGTTKRFLQLFGLKSLEELPNADSLGRSAAASTDTAPGQTQDVESTSLSHAQRDPHVKIRFVRPSQEEAVSLGQAALLWPDDQAANVTEYAKEEEYEDEDDLDEEDDDEEEDDDDEDEDEEDDLEEDEWEEVDDEDDEEEEEEEDDDEEWEEDDDEDDDWDEDDDEDEDEEEEDDEE